MLSSISTPLDVQALVVERADKSAKKTCCAIHWIEIYSVESEKKILFLFFLFLFSFNFFLYLFIRKLSFKGRYKICN